MDSSYLTSDGNVLECKQENTKALGQSSGRQAERDRRFWLAVRRALFIVIQGIEERYDMPVTKVGR